MRIILKQLEKAAADKDLLRQLELEEQAARETEAAIGQLRRDLEAKDKVIDEKDKYIKELLEKLEEKKVSTQ